MPDTKDEVAKSVAGVESFSRSVSCEISAVKEEANRPGTERDAVLMHALACQMPDVKDNENKSSADSFRQTSPTDSSKHLGDMSGEGSANHKQCDVTKTGQYRSHKRHRLKRKDEEPQKCNICEKRFSGTASLKVHMRIHTSENLYKYDICERELTFV